MNLKELKQTAWYSRRPKVIQEAINLLPPMKLYKFKDSGKQCHLISYEEPESGKIEDLTVTVQKTGVGGVLEEIGLSELDTNQVFDVKINNLEEWVD